MNAYEWEKKIIEEEARLAKQEYCHHDSVVAIFKDNVSYNGIESARCKCLECDGTFDGKYEDISSRAIKVNSLDEYNKLKEIYDKLVALNTPTNEIIDFMVNHKQSTKTR